MTEYTAELVVDNKLTRIFFECETGKFADYIWGIYGMSTYVSTIQTMEDYNKKQTTKETKEEID